MKPYVYILTNKTHSVLYIGVTAHLKERIWQHKNAQGCAFTQKYNCCKLVLVEPFNEMLEAITREKQLKKWKRSWKDKLIVESNPKWDDLSDYLIFE